MLALLRGCTGESAEPRPHFQALQYRLCSVLSIATLLFFYFSYYKNQYLPSLRRTSAPIQIDIVFRVLGTQENLCYLVAGLFERDHLHPTPPSD